MAALPLIVRVLTPGGEALISDYKHTAEYAEEFRRHGLAVKMRWGHSVTTFSAAAGGDCAQAAWWVVEPPKGGLHLKSSEERTQWLLQKTLV